MAEPADTAPPDPVPCRTAPLPLALALGSAAVLAWYATFPLTDALSAAQNDYAGGAGGARRTGGISDVEPTGD